MPLDCRGGLCVTKRKFFDHDWLSRSRQIKEAKGIRAADLLKETAEAYAASRLAAAERRIAELERMLREVDDRAAMSPRLTQEVKAALAASREADEMAWHSSPATSQGARELLRTWKLPEGRPGEDSSEMWQRQMCEFAEAYAASRLAAAERRIAELKEALQGIIDIGKRDMSNPKYDAYFETAEAALAASREG